MPTWKSSPVACRTPTPSISLMNAPTPIALKSCMAASAPLCPALCISEAATDSGKGSPSSSTITRLSIVTKRIPRMPPRTISAAAVRYSGSMESGVKFHMRSMTNAGIVNTAPAATDSPMEPTVRAKFSSSSVPFIIRRTAMPMTAAGYVAAIVMPAFSPR